MPVLAPRSHSLVPVLLAVTLAVLPSESRPADGAFSWPDLSTLPKEAPRSPEGAKDAAVIVGLEEYDRLPSVTGARANAEAWHHWLAAVRGVPRDRIWRLVDRGARKREVQEALVDAASQIERDGILWFIWIGHGSPPEVGSDQNLLLSYSADPGSSGFGGEGIERGYVERTLLGGDPNHHRGVMVLDACFSGKTSSGAALREGAQWAGGAASWVAAGVGGKITMLAAARGTEVAGPLPGAARPAYSYLLLGGLRGWGDKEYGRSDGRVSLGEAHRYAVGALRTTLVGGRTQQPDAAGDLALDVAPSLGETGPTLSVLPGRPTPPSEIEIITTDDEYSRMKEEATKLRLEREEAERKSAEAQEKAEAARKKLLEDGRVALLDKRGKQFREDIEPLMTDGASEEEAAVVEKWAKDAAGDRVRVDGLELVAVAPQVERAQKWTDGYRARRAPPKDWTSPTLGLMKGIPLPPGAGFTMGCKPGRDDVAGVCYDNETPVTGKLTKGYWLMEKEVTQGQWKAVMGENPVATGTQWWSNAEHGPCKGVGVGDDLPVACVSWDDVQLFVRAASTRDKQPYRLPTEAEWEWAARGGREQAWPGTGSEVDLCTYGNVVNEGKDYSKIAVLTAEWKFTKCDDGHRGLASVGTFRPNGYALYDMSGNVWEWVEDAYAGTLLGGENPISEWGSTSKYRVLRGGSWYNSARSARVAGRFRNEPGGRNGDLGFRLARSVP